MKDIINAVEEKEVVMQQDIIKKRREQHKQLMKLVRDGYIMRAMCNKTYWLKRTDKSYPY